MAKEIGTTELAKAPTILEARVEPAARFTEPAQLRERLTQLKTELLDSNDWELQQAGKCVAEALEWVRKNDEGTEA